MVFLVLLFLTVVVLVVAVIVLVAIMISAISMVVRGLSVLFTVDSSNSLDLRGLPNANNFCAPCGFEGSHYSRHCGFRNSDCSFTARKPLVSIDGSFRLHVGNIRIRFRIHAFPSV